MATGGATWDTAGALDLGAGNTFTVADATMDGEGAESFAHDLAWWVFTPTTSQRATLVISEDASQVLFRGESYATRDDLGVVDFDTDNNPIYELTAGETYHLMLGHFTFVDPTTYSVGYSKLDALYSPWITLPDNYLIVSSDGGPLQAENPAPWSSWQFWMRRVIRRDTSTNARLAHWDATEVLGGDDPNGAQECVWAHTQNGEFGPGQLWNGGGGPADTSPGICLALGVTPPDNGFAAGAIYNQDPAGPPTGEEGGPPPGVARVQEADIYTVARALYWLPVRDNMPPGGTGSPPSAEEAGYPDAIGGEWEGGDSATPKLLKVEFTTDNFGTRYTAGEITDNQSIAVALHTSVRPGSFAVHPDDDTFGTYAQWPIGQVKDVAGIGETLIYDHWTGGDPTWHDIPDQVAGDTGWDNSNDYSSEGPGQDEMAVLAAWTPFISGTPVDGGGGNEQCDIALRFKLRPKRWRFILGYGTAAVPYPRRLIQRPVDGLASGGQMTYRATGTTQRSNRTIGASW